MIQFFLRYAYSSIICVLCVGLGVGLFFGVIAGLAVALISIVILFTLHLRYFKIFIEWLESPSLDPLPEAKGLWGTIFLKVYKARKKTEKNAIKLHEKEQRFRQTLNSLPDGVILVRKHWEIELLNPIAERDFGLNGSEDIGKRLTDVYKDPEFVRYILSGSWEQSMILTPADGRKIELRVFPAGKKYWIVVSRDETEIMRADAMRRDFVANVSHELRTPLTVIKGFLELQGDNPTATDEERLHWKMMTDQAERMGALVDDLLTLSRLERDSAPAVKTEVDPQELLEHAVEDGASLSQGRHCITVTHIASEIILGDIKEMRSAVTNLVTNAVRYTPDGGKINISWTVIDGEGHIDVSDNGVGIAPEDISRVTERFYRSDKSRSRETGGTGLGLAIVKHVLFRHQAKLQIESKLGEGSIFRIVIPGSRISKRKEN